METIIETIADLESLVEKLLAYANGRKKMLFYGEIGAGKTTFIQAFCRHFTVNESVTSPTYSLINEYSYLDEKTNKEAFIYHMDLYRLKEEREALDIGIEDYLYNSAYCLIEWPEVIEHLLPEEAVKIKVEILENSARKVIFL